MLFFQMRFSIVKTLKVNIIKAALFYPKRQFHNLKTCLLPVIGDEENYGLIFYNELSTRKY